LAAREPLEQIGDELRRDALAAVFDRQPEVAVVLVRANDDGRRTVAERVHDQVRENPVERVRVDFRLEPRVDLDVDVRRACSGRGGDDLLDARTNGEHLRLDRHGLGIEP
jgi:hypothetical protein